MTRYPTQSHYLDTERTSLWTTHLSHAMLRSTDSTTALDGRTLFWDRVQLSFIMPCYRAYNSRWSMNKYKLFISLVPINSTIQQVVINGHFTYNNWYRQVKSQHRHIYTIMMCHLNQRHHATQSYYPDSDTEPNSPCPILIMLNSWLGNDK